MKKVKGTLGPAVLNWKALAGFEALYKLAAVLLFVPLLLGMFALLMWIDRFTYLTHENIGAFLTDPLTLLALGALFLLGAAYVTVDISAVTFALDQSLQSVSVAPGQILRFALRNAARIWRPENLPLVPASLLLMPLAGIGPAASLFATVSIPAAIPRYLRDHPAIPVLGAALLILATVLGARWFYGFYAFTVEGCHRVQVRRRCVELGRGHRGRDLAILLTVQGASTAAYLFLLLPLMALAALFGRLFSGLVQLNWPGSFTVWLAAILSLWVIAALAVPVEYGCAGLLYYRRATALGDLPAHTAAPDKCHSLRHRLLMAGAALTITAGSLTLGFLLSTGGINPDIEYLHTTEITAHRGASAFYPENTMASFTGAKELGADWIELDVQQCRDGQLIVLHDTNLKRTTGLDANTWDLTYEQIAVLDAGSFFSGEFAGERIPLLEDVLAFAGENGIRLNIELKPTGHGTELERQVVDAIRQAGLEEECVITSQSYEVLERVKSYDESIPTVYVLRFAFGNIDQLPAADHFSVEAGSVTRTLISRIHNAGKSLYAWTVNTEKAITRMIDMGVDNIITDDIDLAKQCVYENRYSDLLGEYVDLLSEPHEGAPE